MISRIIIHLLAAFGYITGAVWGVVEGIDYFVNQDQVNWLFLLPLIGGIVIMLINIISMFLKR